MKKLALIAALAFGASSLVAEGDSAALFKEKILPVLTEKCIGCHTSAKGKPAAKLALDTKAGLVKGGRSGVAVVAGDAEKSLIVQVLKYKMEDADMNMPPKKKGGKLDDAIIADFEKWVKSGAVDTREK